MKQFLFAVAVVALSACAADAQQPTTGTTTAPATPVIISAAPVVEYGSVQTQQRRGLFGRLRNRNTTSYYSTPTTVTPTTSTPTLMPMPGTGTTPTPTPMPTIKPTNGTSSGTIIQATGSLPAGTYTTTDGTIIQIGGTQPMTTTTERRGLFGRLRNR